MQLLTIADVCQMSLASLVVNYLMSSYAYEQLHCIYMEDDAYDECCRRLDKHWDEVEHPHKYLIDRDALSATTGFYLNSKQIPGIIRCTAQILVGKARNNQLFAYLRATA